MKWMKWVAFITLGAVSIGAVGPQASAADNDREKGKGRERDWERERAREREFDLERERDQGNAREERMVRALEQISKRLGSLEQVQADHNARLKRVEAQRRVPATVAIQKPSPQIHVVGPTVPARHPAIHFGHEYSKSKKGHSQHRYSHRGHSASQEGHGRKASPFCSKCNSRGKSHCDCDSDSDGPYNFELLESYMDEMNREHAKAKQEKLIKAMFQKFSHGTTRIIDSSCGCSACSSCAPATTTRVYSSCDSCGSAMIRSTPIYQSCQ